MKTQDEVEKSAEQYVIGAILIDEKVLANVVGQLSAEYFYFDEFKSCYQAILELSSEGKNIDFLSVLKNWQQKAIPMKTKSNRYFWNALNWLRLSAWWKIMLKPSEQL